MRKILIGIVIGILLLGVVSTADAVIRIVCANGRIVEVSDDYDGSMNDIICNFGGGGGFTQGGSALPTDVGTSGSSSSSDLGWQSEADCQAAAGALGGGAYYALFGCEETEAPSLPQSDQPQTPDNVLGDCCASVQVGWSARRDCFKAMLGDCRTYFEDYIDACTFMTGQLQQDVVTCTVTFRR
jgi:hypothetical protein